MVEKMNEMNSATLSATSHERHELAVGAGASIVVAVATSIILVLTLLVASYAQPAHAAAIGEAAGDTNGAIAGIVVIAVLAAWLRAMADLWRAVINRVRTWDLFRV